MNPLILVNALPPCPPVSGWRSFEEQTDIYQNSLVRNGRSFTRKYVALPGHSEHQTGLAIDLSLRGLALEEYLA